MITFLAFCAGHKFEAKMKHAQWKVGAKLTVGASKNQKKMLSLFEGKFGFSRNWHECTLLKTKFDSFLIILVESQPSKYLIAIENKCMIHWNITSICLIAMPNRLCFRQFLSGKKTKHSQNIKTANYFRIWKFASISSYWKKLEPRKERKQWSLLITTDENIGSFQT